MFIIVFTLLFAAVRLPDLLKKHASSVMWVHLLFISSIYSCMKSDFTRYLGLGTLSLFTKFEIAFYISTL